MFRFTPVVTNLILANVGVFLIGNYFFSEEQVFNLLGLHFFGSPLFNPLQFFTYMFVHAGFGHIFWNMFALVIFGPLLEETWGGKRFLAYYILCGLGAGLLYGVYQYFDLRGLEDAYATFMQNPSPDTMADFFYHYARDFYSEKVSWIDTFRMHPNNPQFIQQAQIWVNGYYHALLNAPMIGASGAVFGILIAFGMLFPNTELIIFPIFIPIKAKYIVALYGIIAYFGAIRQSAGDHTAHIAHLAGMLVGFIIIKYWQKQRTRFY